LDAFGRRAGECWRKDGVEETHWNFPAQQTVAYRRTSSASRIIESYGPGATRAAEMTVAVARRTQAKRVEAFLRWGPHHIKAAKLRERLTFIIICKRWDCADLV